MVSEESWEILIALDLLGQPNFAPVYRIGFCSPTNQKNGSSLVYTLDVMAPVFSFVVLVQLPKPARDSH